MESKAVIGIDPGLSGALAWHDGIDVIVVDMPVWDLGAKGKEINNHQLLAELQSMKAAGVDKVWIELARSMPGQGVASTFKYGTTYGAILMACAGLDLPYETVTPTIWKRHFHLNKDKDASRARASILFPTEAAHFQRKKDHGRAEAALIARYGWEKRDQ